MNAWLGFFMRRTERDMLSSPLSRPGRWWTDATLEDIGPVYTSIDGVHFAFLPQTGPVYEHLPSTEVDIDYVELSGPLIDTYNRLVWWADVYDCDEYDDENEAQVADAVAQLELFEAGMAELLNRLSFWALRLVPDSEEMGTFVTVDADTALKLLRSRVADWASYEGFVATSLPRAEQATGVGSGAPPA